MISIDYLNSVLAVDYLNENYKAASCISAELSDTLNTIRNFLPGGEAAEALEAKAIKLSEFFIKKLRITSQGLSELAAAIPEFLKEENPRLKIGHPDDFIRVYIEEAAIFIRLPRLWSRNTDSGKCYGPAKDRIFGSELYSKFLSCMEQSDIDYSLYSQKLLHFLYVYSSYDSAPPDNDNFETKYIQDAVCCLLPGGDGALNCFNFLSAVVSDSIPHGTYLTVTPLRLGLLGSDKIIEFWKGR